MDSVSDQSVIDSINDTPPTDLEKSSKSLNIFLIVFGTLLIGIFVIMLQFVQKKPYGEELTVVASPTPQIHETAIPSITDQLENWKTYEFPKLKLSMKTLNSEPKQTVKSYEEYKQGAITVTDTYLFSADNLKRCNDDYSQNQDICLIPGKNWNQTEDFQALSVANKSSLSFFIAEPTYNSIIHVIHITSNPKIEIATAVDGAGSEQIFQKILSSFKFTDQQDTAVSTNTYTGYTFVYQNSIYSGYSFTYARECVLSNLELNCTLDHGTAIIRINAGGHGYGQFESKKIKDNETKTISAGEGKITYIEDMQAKTVLGTYWINKTEVLTQEPIFGFEFRDIPIEDLNQFEQLFDQLLSSFKFLNR